MENFKDEEQAKRDGIPWGKLTLAMLPFLILAVFVLWMNLRTPPQDLTSEPETVLAEETFSDGSGAAILEAVAGDSLIMTSRRKKPIWRPVSGGNSFTYAKDNIDFKVDTRNGVFDSVELQRSDPSLIVLLRFRCPFGSDLVPNYTYFAGEGEIEEVKRDSNEVFKEFVAPRSFPAAQEESIIEVEDGGGGWLRMTGPVAIDGQDGRAFAVTPNFPRRSPHLKLRLTQPTLKESVEVVIPNPGYHPAGFPSWKIEPKPWKKELSEVTVHVKAIEKMHISRSNRIVPQPDFQIEPLSDLPAEAFLVRNGAVEDETGNRSSAFEFSVLPGTDKLRFHGTVTRSRKYPWSAREITLVAEGLWTDDEPEQPLTLLPGAANLGLKSMSLHSPSSTGKADTWAVAFKGQAPKANLPDRFRLILFFGDEERTTKTSTSLNGSGTHNRSGLETYDYRIRWKGAIPAGEKVRVGFLPDPVEDSFNFVLPIDPRFIPKPADQP